MFVLDKEDIIDWIEIVDHSDTVWKKWPDVSRLMKLCSWGLIDFQIESQQGYSTGLITVSHDAQVILKTLRKTNLNEK